MVLQHNWSHVSSLDLKTTHSGGRDIPRHPFPSVGWCQTACSGAPAGGRGNGVGSGILWFRRNPEAPPSRTWRLVRGPPCPRDLRRSSRAVSRKGEGEGDGRGGREGRRRTERERSSSSWSPRQGEGEAGTCCSPLDGGGRPDPSAPSLLLPSSIRRPSSAPAAPAMEGRASSELQENWPATLRRRPPTGTAAAGSPALLAPRLAGSSCSASV
jgi:hypothetical protein